MALWPWPDHHPRWTSFVAGWEQKERVRLKERDRRRQTERERERERNRERERERRKQRLKFYTATFEKCFAIQPPCSEFTTGAFFQMCAALLTPGRNKCSAFLIRESTIAARIQTRGQRFSRAYRSSRYLPFCTSEQCKSMFVNW